MFHWILPLLAKSNSKRWMCLPILKWWMVLSDADSKIWKLLWGTTFLIVDEQKSWRMVQQRSDVQQTFGLATQQLGGFLPMEIAPKKWWDGKGISTTNRSTVSDIRNLYVCNYREIAFGLRNMKPKSFQVSSVGFTTKSLPSCFVKTCWHLQHSLIVSSLSTSKPKLQIERNPVGEWDEYGSFKHRGMWDSMGFSHPKPSQFQKSPGKKLDSDHSKASQTNKYCICPSSSPSGDDGQGQFLSQIRVAAIVPN